MHFYGIKILIGIVGIIGVILFGFFVFLGEEQQNGDSAEVGSIPDNTDKDGFVPKTQVFKPITRTFREIVEYFIEKPSPETPNSNKEKTLAEHEDEAEALSQRMTQNRLYTPRSLTEEEIFDQLWPPSYREHLLELEELFVENNVISPAEKHDTVLRDEDGYAILFQLADYMEKKGILPSQDVERYRRAVLIDLPRELEKEREALRQNGKSVTLVPGYQNLAGIKFGNTFFITDIIEGLKFIISSWSAEEARAGWFVSPDCYKDNDPNYTVPGFNNKTICCDCGENSECGPDGCICIFEEHCGPSLCDCANFGCLNGQCGDWPNAIWDPATQTCGCG